MFNYDAPCRSVSPLSASSRGLPAHPSMLFSQCPAQSKASQISCKESEIMFHYLIGIVNSGLFVVARHSVKSYRSTEIQIED